MTNKQIVNPHQNYCLQIRATSQITKAQFGLDWEEIAHLANEHTLAVQQWLSSRSPKGKQINRLGLTYTTTGLSVALLNLVLDSKFAVGSNNNTINNEITRLKAFYAKHQVPFLWWLSPFATPTNIGEHLLRHNFEADQYRLPTMVAPLTSTMAWPAFNPKIQVWAANNQADLEAASLIRHRAFGFPKGVALHYFEDMSDDWLKGNPARLYMARVGNEGPPTAIGALIMGNGIPGVYVMATLSNAEGQGLGKAILTRILSQAAADGHTLIALTASPQAYSLYRKFGFEHIFEYTIYRLA